MTFLPNHSFERAYMSTLFDDPEYLFTVSEIADYLRVSKMTVYRLLDSDELGHMRIGRTFRIPAAAFTEYLRVNSRVGSLR
jgi:excisionase family DNA binding protein